VAYIPVLAYIPDEPENPRIRKPDSIPPELHHSRYCVDHALLALLQKISG
jgi:hypothetical protein